MTAIRKLFAWRFMGLLTVVAMTAYLGWKNYGPGITFEVARQLRSSPILTCNALTYIYIVGVEGVGHHAVSPAIATIAKTCNKHVLYEMKKLRTGQYKKSNKGFKAQIAKLGSAQYGSNDVVIIEDSSFPSGTTLRNATQQELKAAGHYDLEWLHNEMHTNFPNMNVKYFYLDRDFYRTVASHPEFDGGFQQHAQVLHTYMWHIHSEYTKIKKKNPDIWRQISYEWFTTMDKPNCTAIVSAVVDFMKWDQCDVEFACQTLMHSVHRERKKPIIPEDYAYAQTFNTKLPIPVLEVSPGKKYRFTTVVSKRERIEIISDAMLPPANRTAMADVPVQRESVRSDFSASESSRKNLPFSQKNLKGSAGGQKPQCAPGT